MAAADPDQQLYVEQMAVSQWKLRRMEIGEASLLVQKFGAKTRSRCWTGSGKRRHVWKRSFTRAQRELERLRKSRREQLAEAAANIQHPKSNIPPRNRPAFI